MKLIERQKALERLRSNCKDRGYHDWSESIDSVIESCDVMIISAICKDCGAKFEATGNWTEEGV